MVGRAAALLWRIGAGTSGALFAHPLGRQGLPSLTSFAEGCRLCPPQPPRPKPCRSRLRRAGWVSVGC